VDLYGKTVTIEEAVADPNTTLALTGSRHEGKDETQMRVERASKTRKGQLFNLKYDKLIIAVGAYSQTFNTPGVKEYANFLKDIGDARRIRKRLLECFETASLPTTPDKIRQQILTFAIVGGGPTGIEFSAELYDFIHEDMARIYPDLIKFTKIIVYDVAPNILTAFDDKLAKYAADVFSRNGIEIKTSTHIASLSQGLPEVDPELRVAKLGFTLGVEGEPERGIGMCIWSTGYVFIPDFP
jgi:NADH dehydrogenase FAD-containing subunit